MSETEWEVYSPFNDNPKIQENMSEWEVYNPHNEDKEKENFLISLLKSPFRIGEDIGKSSYEFAKKIPEYLESAKSEVPGLFHTLKEHPSHLGMQALAGSQEGINKLAQLPLNLSKYGENRLHLIPHEITQALSHITPNDTSMAIEELFGNPIYPGEKLARGALRNIPELSGLGKTASLANKLTNKSIVNNVLKTKEMMQEKYSGKNGLYNNLFKRAEADGVKPAININPNKIKFSDLGNKRIKNNYLAIDKLRSGKELSLSDYQKAISELGSIQRELKDAKVRKGTLTDKQDKRYHAAKNAKKYIQENMFKDASGHPIENLLQEHKKIQKGYQKEVLPYTTNKAIQKFELGKIKKPDLIKALRRNPFSAERGQYHLLNTRDKLLKALKIGGGIGLGVGYGLPYVEKFYNSKSEQNR